MTHEFAQTGISLLLFAALVLGTAGLVYAGNFLRFAGAAADWISRALLRVAAGAAFLFDLAMPINERNGHVSANHLTVWIIINFLAVAALIALPLTGGERWAVRFAAAACSLAALVNILFLSGTYFALREGEAVMNDEQNYKGRKGALFADLSTAKSVTLFVSASLFCIAQSGAILTWLQEYEGIAIVAFERRIGLPFLDYLIFVIDAIPFVSSYTQFSGLSEFSAPLAGAGAWVAVGINTVASLLITGGLIALLLQVRDLHAMVERLVERKDTDGKSVLGGRFKRAPAIVKSFVRARFLAETDEDRQLAYLKLALLKPSYGFPATFIRHYRDLPARVRDEGAIEIERFLDSTQLDEAALGGLLDAVQVAWEAVMYGNAKPEDRVRTGRILAAALNKKRQGKGLAEVQDQLRKQIGIKLVTAALREVCMRAQPDSEAFAKASGLLRFANIEVPAAKRQPSKG